MDVERNLELIRRPGVTFDPLSQRVIEAALAVHRKLGPGFREELYENALCIELEKRGISYRRQVTVSVTYDAQLIGSHTLDLVVENSLVIELKAVNTILEVHQQQLLGYLRAAAVPVGLVLNFGAFPLQIKRVVNGYKP